MEQVLLQFAVQLLHGELARLLQQHAVEAPDDAFGGLVLPVELGYFDPEVRYLGEHFVLQFGQLLERGVVQQSLPHPLHLLLRRLHSLQLFSFLLVLLYSSLQLPHPVLHVVVAEPQLLQRGRRREGRHILFELLPQPGRFVGHVLLGSQRVERLLHFLLEGVEGVLQLEDLPLLGLRVQLLLGRALARLKGVLLHIQLEGLQRALQLVLHAPQVAAGGLLGEQLLDFVELLGLEREAGPHFLELAFEVARVAGFVLQLPGQRVEARVQLPVQPLELAHNVDLGQPLVRYPRDLGSQGFEEEVREMFVMRHDLQEGRDPSQHLQARLQIRQPHVHLPQLAPHASPRSLRARTGHIQREGSGRQLFLLLSRKRTAHIFQI